MGKHTFSHFVLDHWTPVPPVEPVDLSGQTVLVVGANVGLGLEAAKHFARMSPRKLIVTCRSVKKGEDTINEIRNATGFDRVYAHTLELSVFASVVSFAEELERAGERIDILVYNAAVAHEKHHLTTDGFEESLQVNAISCVLLCVLLLPRMIAASKPDVAPPSRPRIVVVSSSTHFWYGFKPEHLQSPSMLEMLSDPSRFSDPALAMQQYVISKLFNVFFVRELAQHLPSSSIIVDAVNPGLCVSSLRRSLSSFKTLRGWLYEKAFARTTEAGSRQLVWAAIARRHNEAELHGRYVSEMEVKEESDFVVSEDGHAMQRKIWDEMIDVLSAVSPRFKEIVGQYQLSN